MTQDRGGGLTIIPGPLGNDFAPTDFRSYDAIGRLRHDLGSSFVGAVFTDREIRGGGHNRVIGPDFQWRRNDSDALTGQLLVSQTEDPNRPDLSSAWQGRSSTAHAFSMRWNHFVTKNDGFFRVSDIGNDFRADLGFITQVGYREAAGETGYHWWPEDRFLSYFRLDTGGQYQMDRDNHLIDSDPRIGFNCVGKKNLQSFGDLHVNERIRVGDKMLSQTHLSVYAQIDPSRRLPRISGSFDVGEAISFSRARVGHGATLTFGSTVRPDPRLELSLNASRQWLNVDGGRLFTAQVERVKAIYSFTSKSIVRAIGQYVGNSFPGDQHDGSFTGSVLYSYKLNWQTVLYAGYGDDRVLTNNNELVKLDRSFFFKVSYALQR